MKVSVQDAVDSTDIVYPCGRCQMLYTDYRILLQHLFWRRGTESHLCNKCHLKRWQYAAHICHVLPVDVEFEEVEVGTSSTPQKLPEGPTRESEYCSCGKYISGSKMIGCDAQECPHQWYHYDCIGIVSPPDGEWLCPFCTKFRTSQILQRTISSKNTEQLLLNTG